MRFPPPLTYLTSVCTRAPFIAPPTRRTVSTVDVNTYWETPHGVPGIFGFGVDPANAHVPKILLKSAADAVWAVPKTAGKRSIASNRVEFFNCAPDLMPPTHREAKGPGQTAAKPVGRFHPARRRSRSRCCS